MMFYSSEAFLSTCSVLATAEQAFDIPFDKTAYTLRKILKTVEAIDKKVDVMMKTPIEKATNYCKSVINNLLNQSYSIAYEKLGKVYDEAMTAFSYADKKKNVKSYQDKIEAVRLVMFSQILLLSYDEEKKVFLPYCMLPDNKKRNIAHELGIYLQI